MGPFKRSRDPLPEGIDMDQAEDTAFADNYAELAQAKALREQARAGGLRFEAYLTGDQAAWLLERTDRGRFAAPFDRQGVVACQSGAVRLDNVGRRILQKQRPTLQNNTEIHIYPYM